MKLEKLGSTMTLKTVTLEDKYTLTSGRIFITGTQALVRLPLTQHKRDKEKGLNTAGYISGYRGSPLGGLDEQLQKAHAHLEEHQVKFQPGVNEDLAATAVWGSQQAEVNKEGRYDGVFSIWYGKGPGVDRSGDAFRHGNLAGSSRLGGVLVLMGDDHTCESSTTCHQSEFAMIDAMIPILSPAGVQEILDYGIYGWELSRYSGCWVAMKCVKDSVEATASVDVNIHRVEVHEPEQFAMPNDGLNLRQPDTPHAQEARLHQYKLKAVTAFAETNPIDRIVIDSNEAKLGIVTHGKSYLDTLQALDDLHLTEEQASRMGLRLYKVGLTWPLVPAGAKSFAKGLSLMMVIEEKRSLLEFQLKDILYGLEDAPKIVGKVDEKGNSLFQAEMALDSNQIAIAIGERLLSITPNAELEARLEELKSYRKPKGLSDLMARSFYFCSGCPHNSSTVVPEGSKAYAGIGCSWMAQTMERSTLGYTQMGAEGLSWVGEAPFSARNHMFQNMGDGTYFHSGLLAIRAAVSAKTNITFKILYNDAVAMTGGQRHDGPLDPLRIAYQCDAEGVKKIIVVSDEPLKYGKDVKWPDGVTIHHRDELDTVQRELRDIPGTTILIYDQTCAAEKRRRRKRGVMPDPARRVVINDLVCEGCGDCGVQSNCVSIQPIETEFGRKRFIDQSNCNKDFSCLKGFCPSFVTVEGGQMRKPKPIDETDALISLTEPTLPSLDKGVYSILVTGMGGTGVVTIGAILGMGAHLEGKGCGLLDMAGLAQKGGSVWSHLRFGSSPESIKTIRIAAGGADLVLGCDMIVAANSKTLAATRQGHTRAIVNHAESMPGEFTRNANLKFPSTGLRQNIEKAVGTDRAEFINAGSLANKLIGDSIASNMFMVGFAYQRGLIPISSKAIEAAIELNGTSVKMNLDAFRWGRQFAQDPASVEKTLTRDKGARGITVSPSKIASLDQSIEMRKEFLVNYQNHVYADRYLNMVNKIRVFEDQHAPGKTMLTQAVAKYYFKLLAVKDEYEVARLHTQSGFLDAIEKNFEGPYKINFHLSPAFLSKPDAAGSQPRKKQFGPWIIPIFKVISSLKFLRGTPFDIFGMSQERRMERELIGEYEMQLNLIMDTLGNPAYADRYDIAVQLASIPEDIRGYGHVKHRHVQTARAKSQALMAQLNATSPELKRAA